MAQSRALKGRIRSITNTRKITRTMELIATARFKLAMDRATAATAFLALTVVFPWLGLASWRAYRELVPGPLPA